MKNKRLRSSTRTQTLRQPTVRSAELQQLIGLSACGESRWAQNQTPRGRKDRGVWAMRPAGHWQDAEKPVSAQAAQKGPDTRRRTHLRWVPAEARGVLSAYVAAPHPSSRWVPGTGAPTAVRHPSIQRMRSRQMGLQRPVSDRSAVSGPMRPNWIPNPCCRPGRESRRFRCAGSGRGRPLRPPGRCGGRPRHRRASARSGCRQTRRST